MFKLCCMLLCHAVVRAVGVALLTRHCCVVFSARLTADCARQLIARTADQEML
jgi:hypothetical protein